MDMDQQNPSVHQPLLLSTKATDEKKCTCFFASSAKWVLRTLMWVIFIAWLALIFLYPTQSGNKLVEKWVGATKRTPFGLAGSLFLAFSGPLLLIVFLSMLLLIISGEEEFQHKKKYPSVRLWTFPVLVDGPFGVVSAAECIGILLVLAYVFWAMYAYTIRNLALLPDFHIPPGEESIWMLKLTGLRFGMIGLFCMLFLFLPIARGSFLLRLVDIPFEHATRYHVWLGHLTMMLFTLHGLFYVIGWAFEGKLLQEILEWKDVGIANLAGVISLLAGLLMWITSLHPVRKWNFELFFYTHQLYVVFLLFLAFHVGDFVFSIAAGAISLFILDRFLRFCQSRSTVDIISAKCFPCGTMELVLSKPGNLRYNALSFIFLQIRELSWLQWHPFSVSSSPLDGKYHLSILIKVLGKWTDKLRGSIMSMAEAELQDSPAQRPTITASVEGPYGHEVPYHLMYENLILVAGGIGISPFLAILSDCLHRINDGRPCLPRNIVIVWAVKSSDELPLLSTIDMESICPHHFKRLNLEICIYVTRESFPPLEESKIQKPICTSVSPVPKGCRMSILVGTGDNMWSGVYVISSMVGFAVLLGLLDIFYINPFHVSTWWYNGLLFMGCMLASVLIFGGLVVVLWHIWGRKSSAGDECTEARMEVEKLQHRDDLESKDLHLTNSTASSTTVHYGSRPDFKEIFGSISKRWGHVDAGVIVCGPPALQSSVAREIRSGNLNRESRHAIIFHFHSHSFDL